MASPMPIAVAGKNPGEIFIPMLNRTFQQVELREDDIYDSFIIPSGAIAADTKYRLYQDVTDKNEQHISIQQPRKIASGDEAAVFRVGVHVRGAHGNTVPIFADIKKVLENGLLTLKFNRRLVTQGMLLKYPSGLGIGGFSVESGATSATVGIPSAAAAPTLFVPQQLRDNDDLNAEVEFPNAAWIANYAVPVLTGQLCVTQLLHAIIKSPLGK